MGAILAVLFAAAVGTAAGVTPNDDGQNIYKFDEAKQEFVLIENPSQELIDLHEAARLQSDKDDGPVVMETVEETTTTETSSNDSGSGTDSNDNSGSNAGSNDNSGSDAGSNDNGGGFGGETEIDGI